MACYKLSKTHQFFICSTKVTCRQVTVNTFLVSHQTFLIKVGITIQDFLVNLFLVLELVFTVNGFSIGGEVLTLCICQYVLGVAGKLHCIFSSERVRRNHRQQDTLLNSFLCFDFGLLKCRCISFSYWGSNVIVCFLQQYFRIYTLNRFRSTLNQHGVIQILCFSQIRLLLFNLLFDSNLFCFSRQRITQCFFLSTDQTLHH